MADLSHTIGGDLEVSATGDLATAEALALSEQRVLRRLLTNAGDYIWHPDYGAGLPQMVGKPINVETVNGIIQQQMRLEATVEQNPPPVVIVSSIPNGMFVQITYTEHSTQQQNVLSFDVTN